MSPSASLPPLDDLDVGGKKVLIRGDLNVPLDDGRITDDFRLRALVPTVRRVLERGGRAIVCSHLGRPKGVEARYSLAPVAEALGKALGTDVPLARELEVGDDEIVCLENLRFHPGETANDPSFAEALSSLAEAYVNDAFGSSHRAHASIVGPPARLPSAAGLLLEREVAELSGLVGEPARPYVVVLGGAKVADKIGVVRNLLDRADEILIGGGMCFTFLKALGAEVGRSLLDAEHLDDVRELAAPRRSGAEPQRLKLPVDVVAGEGPNAAAGTVVGARSIPGELAGLDIGPETAEAFAASIRGAGTVFWNGPMGVFENAAFADGSRVVAEAVADCPGHTVTGGGDTSAALAAFGLEGKVDFASTGGGASLEFLEGKELPGIAALTRSKGEG